MSRNYIRAAECLLRNQKLRAAASKLENRAKTLLNLSGNGMAYSQHEQGDGKTAFRLQIPLADYLTLYPEARPEPRTFEYEGQTRVYLDYPDQYVGEGKGVFVLVGARTDSVNLPAPTPAVS